MCGCQIGLRNTPGHRCYILKMPLTRETVIKWSEDVLFAYQRIVELSVPFELAGILSDLILLTSRVDTTVNGITYTSA